MRRNTTWLVVLALALSVLGAAPAAAMHRSSPEAATFNVPAPWGTRGEQFRIIHRVEKAINHVPPRTGGRRSRIYISTFLLDRVISVNALIRACRRGVSVRVVMDGDIASRPSRRLMTVLNADNVTDHNGDGKPDHKPRHGPCDTKLPKKHKHKHDKHKHDKHKHDKGGKNGDKKGKQDKKKNKRDDKGNKGGKNKTKNKNQNKPKDKQRKHHGKSNHDRKHKSDKSKHHKKHKHKHKPKPLTRAQTWGHDRSFAVKCKGTCRGRGYGGNMHSKFYAFSRVKHVHNVVMISSSNLNVGGATLGWNDLWTMKNRPVQFRYFSQIFDQMIRDRVVRHGNYEVKEGPYRTRFFPLVHPKKKNDPTLLDLDRIKCHGPLGPTKIYVSMFYWKGPRGEYLASKLLNLSRDGCQVSVIYGAPSRLIAARLKGDARHHVINLYDSRWDRNYDGIFDVRTHAKYVLVKGHYGKHKKAWRVFTGSQNWVEGSLGLSDETTLNINSRRAYGQYIKDWNMIRMHSRHVQ